MLAVDNWVRPRIKPEHVPYRIPGNRIRIGGTVYGIAAEINDPTGSVWTLLESLDGSRSPEQIVDYVRLRNPGEPAEDIRAALATLIEAGHVEDCGAPVPLELTDREQERYERSRQFYRWIDPLPRTNTWEPQVRLRKASVVVVGIGGTGGTAALALAASGVGTLHCVDADEVELSNLNRQIIYTEKDIGRPKVDAAVDRLRELNSDIAVTGRQCRVNGIEDLVFLAARHDVLLLCADSPPDIRMWTNRACLRTGTPWVDCGYHGPRASAALYVPGSDGACYECLWLAEHDRNTALGITRTYSTGRAGHNAVIAPSAGLSGYLAAYSVIAFITGIGRLPDGRIHGVNLAALETPHLVADPRRADCRACGTIDPGGGDVGGQH
jgi:molybdopterin/thiamine biosynthesis adenylyltransferase